jgi:8-oxo-dGTP pyrophosphatase MutT (NUDIX family)
MPLPADLLTDNIRAILEHADGEQDDSAPLPEELRKKLEGGEEEPHNILDAPAPKAKPQPAVQPAAKEEPQQLQREAAEQYQKDRRADAKKRWKKGDDQDQIIAAGLILKAEDTGRILMIQRSNNDPDDTAAGTWEAPSGHREEGETPLATAKREWSEEVGVEVKRGKIIAQWTSPNGVYRGYLAMVPTEADVPINADPERRKVLNPDDPDGDDAEVVAWWNVDDARKNPALRKECRDFPWHKIEKATMKDSE